jgi:phage shock protein E
MKEILNNASIVDVRTPVEYDEGHYPGAVNIPLNELPQRMNAGGLYDILQLK